MQCCKIGRAFSRPLEATPDARGQLATKQLFVYWTQFSTLQISIFNLNAHPAQSPLHSFSPRGWRTVLDIECCWRNCVLGLSLCLFHSFPDSNHKVCDFTFTQSPREWLSVIMPADVVPPTKQNLRKLLNNYFSCLATCVGSWSSDFLRSQGEWRCDCDLDNRVSDSVP